MSKFLFILFFLIIGLLTQQVVGQEAENVENIRVMFYNIENLFDTIDSPENNDQEFTPEGNKRWNEYRYWKKINQLFQVIAAAGEGSPPEIIGLCEIEEFLPVFHLINNTPLLKYPYKIIHYNSPDKRGIDVALLIRRDMVKEITSMPVRVKLDETGQMATRDILYAKLLVMGDTLHTFTNHWPSRWGGKSKSEPKRLKASSNLRTLTDSLLTLNKQAKVIIMGDFNDEPGDKSIQQLEEGGLINLSKTLEEKCECGTYKYRNMWNMIDQFIVSEGLTSQIENPVDNAVTILKLDFLIQEDKTYGGFKPFRTYQGPQYLGGYSDHLPIMLRIKM